MTRILKSALIAIAVLSLLGCSSAETAQPAAAPAFPPVPVSIGQATEEMVPIELKAFGTVEAFASVDVKSQVAGPLLSVKFVEGSNVSKGDLLFEVDPRPFQEALRQAEAALTKDTAQLHLAEANLARDQANQKNVTSDADRYAQLAREGIATRMQQDQIRTAADMARESVRASEASIESMRAALESDRAAIERAKLDLSYCQIRAPISGRVGNLLVHAGNLVKANDLPLVTINQITPIFVSFGVPERQLNTITSKSGGRRLPVEASLDNSPDRVKGVLTVIDNKVDPQTGTVRLKATFDNKQQALWPGRFVNVVMTLDTQKATVIPAESVQVGQRGSFVYAVKADKTVEPRPVVVGASAGGKVIIEKGIQAGDTVVTDGQSRLFPGATIAPAAQSQPQTQGK
jgi:membrane fusion protein, multidrug efflux system